MKKEELINFPETKKKLYKFIKDLLEGWQKIASESGTVDVYKVTDNDVDQCIEGLLWSNPRLLYEFFDKNLVVLTVNLKSENDITGEWIYKINGGLGTISNDGNYKTRQQAEAEGFKESFKFLEEKL